MSAKMRSESEPHPEVDRAARAVRRAIGRLVQLLGDEDLAVVQWAGLALADLGAVAVVGPLADALPRARGPRHRGAIITVLLAFHPQEEAAILRALTGALGRETEPVLSIHIRTALLRMIGDRTFSSRSPSRSISGGGIGRRDDASSEVGRLIILVRGAALDGRAVPARGRRRVASVGISDVPGPQ